MKMYPKELGSLALLLPLAILVCLLYVRNLSCACEKLTGAKDLHVTIFGSRFKALVYTVIKLFPRLMTLCMAKFASYIWAVGCVNDESAEAR